MVHATSAHHWAEAAAQQAQSERDALTAAHRNDRERLLADRETALAAARADYDAALTRYQQEREAMAAQARLERDRLLSEREKATRQARCRMRFHEAIVAPQIAQHAN